jgi:hypothetical protein
MDDMLMIGADRRALENAVAPGLMIDWDVHERLINEMWKFATLEITNSPHFQEMTVDYQIDDRPIEYVWSGSIETQPRTLLNQARAERAAEWWARREAVRRIQRALYELVNEEV